MSRPPCVRCGAEFDAPNCAACAASRRVPGGRDRGMSVAGQAGGAQIGLLLRLTAAVAVAVAGLLWFTGAASAPLESVGLTQSPCVRTSSGAAVCGHQAEQACKRVGGPSCLDAGYDTRGSVADRVGSQDALAPLP